MLLLHHGFHQIMARHDLPVDHALNEPVFGQQILDGMK
jgi:hypothetical protein